MLLPNPFRGMGAWWKTKEPQKLGNSPGPGPEVVKRQSHQRASSAMSLQLDSAEEMGGVLKQVFAGAAGRILDSAKPGEIKTNRRLCLLRHRQERTQRA